MYRLIIRQILRNGKKGKQKKGGSGKVLVRSIHTCVSISRRRNILSISKAIKGNRLVSLTTNKRSFSTYRIHPAIGIGRLGDSIGYYDEPTTIGGLPTYPNTTKEVTKFRDDTINRGLLRQASVFNIYKYDGDNVEKIDVLSDPNIKSVEWSVWLANKKGGFYEFQELQGNPLLAPFWWDPENKDANANSYVALDTPKRNEHVEDADLRQKLIIDFGPRSASTDDHITERTQRFNNLTVPEDYNYASHPSHYVNSNPDDEDHKSSWKGNVSDITSFGHMHVSEDGQLRIVPGHGATTGKTEIDSFAGGKLWWDDICDGPVRAKITFQDDSVETLTAWCMIGSPKYAPELVNITTMDDVTYDAAVRYNEEFRNDVMVDPTTQKFNLGDTGFKPIFERDIKPILERMKGYDWVANTNVMTAFANPPFNVSTTDPNIITEELEERKLWFSLLREAFPLETKPVTYALAEASPPRQQLFADANGEDTLHIPLMPLNSGDNSVMDNISDTDNDDAPDHQNMIISKFTTVSPTQYYFLYQWANGFVGSDEQDTQSLLCDPSYKINDLDRAAGGNCVGYPTSPGVETTWNIRVPWIYQPDDPYRLLFDEDLFEDLFDTGLTPLRDECVVRSPKNIDKLSNRANPVGKNIKKHPKVLTVKSKTDKSLPIQISGIGLEPGDLTKRMAIPWQADYSNCSYQNINFTDPNIVRDVTKPAYYAYWWPPQAPWNVYLGYEEKEQQEEQGWGRFNEGGSGEKVYYQRGIMEHSDVYSQMIKNWQHLGFIRNTSGSSNYPYFVEQERNHDAFTVATSSSDSGSKSTDTDDCNDGGK